MSFGDASSNVEIAAERFLPLTHPTPMPKMLPKTLFFASFFTSTHFLSRSHRSAVEVNDRFHRSCGIGGTDAESTRDS